MNCLGLDLIDKVMEIISLTNDGNDLTYDDLVMLEHAINFGNEDFVNKIYGEVKSGTYENYYICKNFRLDHEGYVYYKGFNVEHFELPYSRTAKAAEYVRELKRRCEFLEANNIEISCSNAVLHWKEISDEYEREPLYLVNIAKEIVSLCGLTKCVTGIIYDLAKDLGLGKPTSHSFHFLELDEVSFKNDTLEKLAMDYSIQFVKAYEVQVKPSQVQSVIIRGLAVGNANNGGTGNNEYNC